MSPAPVNVHLTFSFETVAVVIGSVDAAPRVLQTFCPYMGQPPASLAQLRGAGGAAASGIFALPESSPLPVHATGANANSTAARARALRQSIDFLPSPRGLATPGPVYRSSSPRVFMKRRDAPVHSDTASAGPSVGATASTVPMASGPPLA